MKYTPVKLPPKTTLSTHWYFSRES